jgi:hypothetical protein
LQTDASLSVLLPHIVEWLAAGVHLNVASMNMALLIYLLRAVHSLDANERVDLRPHLCTLVPAVASAVIADRVSIRPDTDNHWTPREYAARLLISLSKYEPSLHSYALARAYRKDNEAMLRMVQLMRNVYRHPQQYTCTQVYMALYTLYELGVDVGCRRTHRTPSLPHRRYAILSYRVRALLANTLNQLDVLCERGSAAHRSN